MSTPKPTGILRIVGAEHEMEPMTLVVYAWVIVEDDNKNRFRFKAASFHHDLEPLPL